MCPPAPVWGESFSPCSNLRLLEVREMVVLAIDESTTERFAEYSGVECGECYEFLLLRPVNRNNGEVIPYEFPERFKVGHPHSQIFYRAEVQSRTLPHVHNRNLLKF